MRICDFKENDHVLENETLYLKKYSNDFSICFIIGDILAQNDIFT